MRIIAGTARGTVIDAPQGRDTRPTLDRVRENVFNILQQQVRGARTLPAAHQMGAHGRQGKQAADAQQGKRVPDGTGHRHGSHVRRAGLTGHGRVYEVHAHL